MSSLRRPVFFEIPFPTPTTAFNSLPQAVRDAWGTWALGNPVGYLDYQTIIRPAPDAYEFTTQNDAAQNGGTTSIVYPPERLLPILARIAAPIASATESDILAAPINAEATEDTSYLIWGTAPDPVAADINVTDNKFLGVFEAPAGLPAGGWMENIGAAYVSAFGSLTGLAGQFLVLWFFQCRNGSITYQGSATIEVSILSPWQCALYWPLNETSGNRRSISQPNSAAPSGTVTSTTGPIDGALQVFSDTGPIGCYGRDIDWTEYNDGFTVNAWIRFDGTGSLLVFMAAYGNTPFGPTYLQLSVDQSSGWVNWQTWNGTGPDSQNDGGAGAPANATWIMVTAVFDAAAGSLELYRDGASVILQSPWSVGFSEAGYLIMGNDGATTPSTEMDLAEVSLWKRPLSAAEVSALYNSGAALRFPFD